MSKFKRLALSAVGVLSLMSSSVMAQRSFDASQTKAIEEIVHNYLIENPDILVEVAEALQQKKMAAMQEIATKVILENKATLFAQDADPIVGNLNGSVTLIEFFDYQCPHCIVMEPVIQSLLDSNKNLKVIYKEFPIFGDVSDFAARAALASMAQNMYPAFHSALMHANKRLSKDVILKIAKDTGLNVAKMLDDMKDAKIKATLERNQQLAQVLKLAGTPAFIVGPSNVNSINASNLTFIPGETTEESLQDAIAKA